MKKFGSVVTEDMVEQFNKTKLNSQTMFINDTDIHQDDCSDIQSVLSYFEGSSDPPSLFFRKYTWILYVYFGMCIHGAIMNLFMVMYYWCHKGYHTLR